MRSRRSYISIDRAAGRQRVGQLANFVGALASDPKRALRVLIGARPQSSKIAIELVEQLRSDLLSQRFYLIENIVRVAYNCFDDGFEVSLPSLIEFGAQVRNLGA